MLCRAVHLAFQEDVAGRCVVWGRLGQISSSPTNQNGLPQLCRGSYYSPVWEQLIWNYSLPFCTSMRTFQFFLVQSSWLYSWISFSDITVYTARYFAHTFLISLWQIEQLRGWNVEAERKHFGAEANLALHVRVSEGKIIVSFTWMLQLHWNESEPMGICSLDLLMLFICVDMVKKSILTFWHVTRNAWWQSWWGAFL